MSPVAAPAATLWPLRYARGNLLFGRGDEHAALYRVPMVSYRHKPTAEKFAEFDRLATFMHTIGADFSLWRVNRTYPADRYADQAAELLDDHHQDPAAWREFLSGHTQRLGQLQPHIPELYLGVSLQNRAEARLGGALIRGVDRARRRLEDLAGVGTPQPVSGSELRSLAATEQNVYERLGMLYAERATTRQLQWLARRAACRGVAEPTLDQHWIPDALQLEEEGELMYEPLEVDVWRLANPAILEEWGREERSEDLHGPRLVIDSDDGRSYQTILCLGAMPETATFPGSTAELLFAPLERLKFPFDAVLHARWVGNRQALAEVRKRIMDADNNYREAAQHSLHGASWRSEEAPDLAREYEHILQSEAHPPMLFASVSFVVAAATGRELEQRVTALRDEFSGITLHRPPGIQEQLYFDCHLRTGGGVTPDYVQQLTVEQFAATMPIGTRRVGSARGSYIGWITGGAERPVKFDPTEASREDRTSAILFAGTLGSGKTVAAETIAFIAERRGSLVVDWDPKLVPDHHFDRIPELAGRVDVIELSGNEEMRGKLDPLTIGMENVREELAVSYYLELLREPPASWERALQSAVRDVVRRGGRGSLQVIETLQRSDQEAAREVAEALENVADFGLARLGFGDGQIQADRAVKPVTTIRMPGLTLPEPDTPREHYQRVERISVATLQLVAAYALRLVSDDHSRHKFILGDEAWFILASAYGRAVINRLVRAGRGMNATIALATQRLADLGELAGLFGTMFIFGQESKEEAQQALKLLGLDPNDRELIRLLRSWASTKDIHGRCFMRDLDDRVDEVQIDLVYKHLLEALNTTPPRRRPEVATEEEELVG